MKYFITATSSDHCSMGRMSIKCHVSDEFWVPLLIFFILHWLGTYVRVICEVIELGVRVWIGALEGASIGWHSWWNVLWWWVWIGIVGVTTVSLSVCIISLPVLLYCCFLCEIELEQRWSDARTWAYVLHRLQANTAVRTRSHRGGRVPLLPRATVPSGTGGSSPAPSWTPRMSD